MLKATLRSAVLLGLLAVGLFAISMPSFAEVQNVRVGGDITIRGFHRENMDLTDDDGSFDRHDYFFMNTTGLNVGADLTENVGAFVRIVNERDWNAQGATAGASQDTDDVGLSQAYITLKELFYSPLTLRIGTQPIVWGRGFIIGSNFFPEISGNLDDRNAAISANEYTEYTAFDAIRTTLDLSNLGGMSMPLVADYVYIKSDENAIGVPDDVTIQGINFSSKLESFNSEVEAYYVNKRDRSGTDNASVNTMGFRGSSQPAAGANVYGELAYQWGTRATDPETIAATGSGHQAWAADLGGDYTFADVSMTPKLGAEWIFWSGATCGTATCGGWDPIARGYFTTAIREFMTDVNGGGYAADQAGVTGGATNQHQIGFYGGLVPVEDLNVNSRLSFFFLDKPAIQGQAVGGGKNVRRSYAGTEWDTNFVYSYTDDVSLGFLYAVFWPGTTYESATDNIAQQLVTTVSVKF